jgi:mitosis inhibitor protein kinase SWE1
MLMDTDRGEPWHRLRQEDFGGVEMEGSPELFGLIKRMMRTLPGLRVSAEEVYWHPVVRRARTVMERDDGTPLGRSSAGFLGTILSQ